MRMIRSYKKIEGDNRLLAAEDRGHYSVDRCRAAILLSFIFCLLLPASFSSKVMAQGRQLDAATADSIKICTLLKNARQQPADTNLPLFFARGFIGKPYVAHTLEVGDKERLVVNTRELDCTTLVETVTALTKCAYQKKYTYAAYRAALQTMRYRNGKIDNYTSRIHYFTEWITLNSEAGIVTEIQAPNPPFSAIQQVNVNYMSSHPESYKALRAHPEYVPVIRQMEQTITGQRFRYIPKQAVKNNALLRQAINDGDIIAITCKKPGLDIAHLGFAVWQADGLHLLNASMLHKKVVEEPMTLYRYLQQHSTHTGIRIIRILK